MGVEMKNRKAFGVIMVSSILVALGMSLLPWMGTIGMANPKTADEIGLWINFLGKFHPVFLHLPIGAIVLVFSMEVIGLFSSGKYKPNTTVALAFAAGTSVFAVVCGYFLYLTGKFEGPLVEEHKRDGIIFGVLVIASFLLKFSYELKVCSWIKPTYWIMLIATIGAMIGAGHHGGEITHGDPFNALPSKVLEKREANISQVDAADPVVYLDIVHPILENKCIECHGDDKTKGGLRMDSMAAMFEGGDEEECLVPGDVDASYMITTIMLPKDDDYHMPPEDKPQINSYELEILKWWVQIGAPDKKKLSELEAPSNIIEAIHSLK